MPLPSSQFPICPSCPKQGEHCSVLAHEEEFGVGCIQFPEWCFWFPGVWFCPRWCSTCVPLRNSIGVSSTSNNFWECCRSTVPCFSGHLRTGLTSWAQGCSHDLKCITSIPVTPHQTKLSLCQDHVLELGQGGRKSCWIRYDEIIDTICVFDHSFLDASWSQDETYKYIRSLDKLCKVHDAPAVMTLWLWHPDMFGLMPFV